MILESWSEKFDLGDLEWKIRSWRLGVGNSILDLEWEIRSWRLGVGNESLNGTLGMIRAVISVHLKFGTSSLLFETLSYTVQCASTRVLSALPKPRSHRIVPGGSLYQENCKSTTPSPLFQISGTWDLGDLKIYVLRLLAARGEMFAF